MSPPGAKCGTTSPIAMAETAVPAAAMTRPARRRPRPNAYQSPRAATTRPMCSFVRQAATATTANGTSRSSSRNQNAASRSGVASATGWNSFSASHCVGG